MNKQEQQAQASQHYLKHYAALKGKTVVNVVRDGGSEYTEECFGLLFHDGTTAWILCDPEGNGPGHLAIEPPTPKKDS